MAYLDLDLASRFCRLGGYDALSADNQANFEVVVDSACALIENHTGKIQAETITEVHDGGDISIYLRRPPIVSITSVTEIIGITTYTLTLQPPGSSTSNFGYDFDPAYGRLVRRGAGGQPFPFFDNKGNVTVVYLAGMADVPANILHATLELTKHLWSFSQQSGRPQFGEPVSQPGAPSGPGYALPNRVVELLGINPRPIVLS